LSGRPGTTLGVDVGTTGCKIVAFSSEGVVLDAVHATYPLLTPQPGAAELDTSLMWSAISSSIEAVCRSARVLEPPERIGITTAGEALIPLDRAGKALYNAVTSIDTRSVEVFRRFTNEHGTERTRSISGLEPLPHYSVFRWRWFAETHPAIYARTATLGGHAEWLSAHLGAETLSTDTTLAARSCAYQVSQGRWSDEVLSLIGIDGGRLPSVVTPGTVIGLVKSGCANRLGVAPRAEIVISGLDQACAAFALSLPNEQTAMLSIGTTAVLGLELETARPRAEDNTPEALQGPGIVPVGPHVRANHRLMLAGTPAGGALLKWYEAKLLGRSDQDSRDIEDHRTEVLALPHLGGSRVAFADPDATGAIIGLRFSSNSRDIRRALLDSVAYELAVILDRFNEAGARVMRLRATGGGSLSQGWVQTIADALDRPIDGTATEYAAAIGAAAIASRGTNSDPGNPFVPVQRTFYPRDGWIEYHIGRLDRFRQLYTLIAEERSRTLEPAR
jgi:xylulokinase